jgi:hypothetical protein
MFLCNEKPTTQRKLPDLLMLLVLCSLTMYLTKTWGNFRAIKLEAYCKLSPYATINSVGRFQLMRAQKQQVLRPYATSHCPVSAHRIICRVRREVSPYRSLLRLPKHLLLGSKGFDRTRTDVRYWIVTLRICEDLRISSYTKLQG